MRFYTKPHPLYCGIDLHARTMYVCMLNHDGEIVVHRHMRPPVPRPLLKTMAPHREQSVMAVACLFTWYWLADLCAREGMPFVLGHALSMNAIHGGKAKNDTSDAKKIAVLLRGGMLPQAYVYPAERRATRALLRRRRPRMRKRAELLTHVQPTNCPYNVPEMGKKIAYKATRAGGAERFPDPAVPKSSEVDLACSTPRARLLQDLAWTMVTPAKQHDATTLYLLQTVPGIGKRLSLVLLYDMHDMAPAARGGKISCPLAAWSKARRSRQASGMAPPARRSGRRTSKGRGLLRSGGLVPPQPSCRAKSIWPVERKTRPGPGLNGLGASARPGGL